MSRVLFSIFCLLAVAAAAVADDAVSPKETITLFNGKDLTNFYTWLNAPPGEKQVLGKNNDPKKVFSVVTEDSKPAIRVSGEVFGCFTTEKEYRDYHLIVEFKWGQKTFPPREKATRDSGILLHCIGEDGAAGGSWMESIECQMIEGGTGDFILVAGKGKRPKITATVRKDGNQWYFDPKGEAREFTGGRINWYGRDPAWKDTLGYRGPNDVEKPVGEWNTLECVCNGDRITNILNGKVVNEGTKAFPTSGKILFQSEGAELFFRKIELHPVKK